MSPIHSYVGDSILPGPLLSNRKSFSGIQIHKIADHRTVPWLNTPPSNLRMNACLHLCEILKSYALSSPWQLARSLCVSAPQKLWSVNMRPLSVATPGGELNYSTRRVKDAG